MGAASKKCLLFKKINSSHYPNIIWKTITVTVTGKVLDVRYAQKLALMPDLSLDEIILLDKIQKGISLNDEEVKMLRTNSLIEGGNLICIFLRKLQKNRAAKGIYQTKWRMSKKDSKVDRVFSYSKINYQLHQNSIIRGQVESYERLMREQVDKIERERLE